MLLVDTRRRGIGWFDVGYVCIPMCMYVCICVCLCVCVCVYALVLENLVVIIEL